MSASWPVLATEGRAMANLEFGRIMGRIIMLRFLSTQMVFGWKLFIRIPNSPTFDFEEGNVN
jgi:hypothetical protein